MNESTSIFFKVMNTIFCRCLGMLKLTEIDGAYYDAEAIASTRYITGDLLFAIFYFLANTCSTILAGKTPTL
jgi:hypothetical protein